MHYVYVLYSEDYKRYYTGMSQDVEKRLLEHNRGKTKSTKPYRPWRVILTETFPTRIEARKREVYLKSGQGRDYIKKIMAS